MVFQDLDCGARCALIESVTGSRYTHVGVVLEDEGEFVVWEAFAPVGPTPLSEWVWRGVGHEYAVYRPRAAVDSARLRSALERWRGRDYDGDYQWDHERIYCSELVALAFGELGLEIAPSPIALGEDAARVRRLSGGRIEEGTMMVTPRALTEHEGFGRIWDPLR